MRHETHAEEESEHKEGDGARPPPERNPLVTPVETKAARDTELRHVCVSFFTESSRCMIKRKKDAMRRGEAYLAMTELPRMASHSTL